MASNLTLPFHTQRTKFTVFLYTIYHSKAGFRFASFPFFYLVFRPQHDEFRYFAKRTDELCQILLHDTHTHTQNASISFFLSFSLLSDTQTQSQRQRQAPNMQDYLCNFGPDISKVEDFGRFCHGNSGVHRLLRCVKKGEGEKKEVLTKHSC